MAPARLAPIGVLVRVPRGVIAWLPIAGDVPDCSSDAVAVYLEIVFGVQLRYRVIRDRVDDGRSEGHRVVVVSSSIVAAPSPIHGTSSRLLHSRAGTQGSPGVRILTD